MYTNPTSPYARQQRALTAESDRLKLKRVRAAMELAAIRRNMSAKNTNSSKY